MSKIVIVSMLSEQYKHMEIEKLLVKYLAVRKEKLEAEEVTQCKDSKTRFLKRKGNGSHTLLTKRKSLFLKSSTVNLKPSPPQVR